MHIGKINFGPYVMHGTYLLLLLMTFKILYKRTLKLQSVAFFPEVWITLTINYSLQFTSFFPRESYKQMKSTAHSSLLSITPFDSPFIPTITVLKDLMIFTVFPNSVLLCNPFQSGILSFRVIALLKSSETSILPLDISVLFLFNCLATFEKRLSSLSLKILFFPFCSRFNTIVFFPPVFFHF